MHALNEKMIQKSKRVKSKIGYMWHKNR